MKSNTNGRRTSTSARRVVPAIAIVALAIGLGACQTPPRGSAVPQAPVIQPAEVPAGVDQARPVDRIVEQLERQAKLTVKPTDRFRGMSADRIEEKLAREQAANGARFEGVPADRIDERLHRGAFGMRAE